MTETGKQRRTLSVEVAGIISSAKCHGSCTAAALWDGLPHNCLTKSDRVSFSYDHEKDRLRVLLNSLHPSVNARSEFPCQHVV